MDEGQWAADGAGAAENDARSSSAQPERAAGWHEMLLALSGRIPDEVVAAARATSPGTDDAVRAAGIVSGLEQVGARMSADDLLALVQALVQVAEPGDAESVAKMLDARGDLPLLGYRFSPLDPGPAVAATGSPADPEATAATGPVSLDRSYENQADWVDQVAVAAVSAATAEPGVVGLWGSWRHPAENAAGPGVRVFMAETTDDAAQQQATVNLQRQLVSAGESCPRIEVFGPQTRLAPYQRSILAAGALLWGPRPQREPQVVPVFDGIDADGAPRFDPGHAELPAGERAKVASYLYTAEQLMVTTATMLDVLDPEQGEVVPLSFRTDGAYIWPEAVGYFAERYGLAPYPPLLEAIRASGYRPPAVDGVDLFRAENALLTGEDE